MRKLIVGGLAMLAFLGAAEWAARIAGFGHPLLYRATAWGYETMADQHIVRLGKIENITMAGTRGSTISPDPSSDIWRVMVLGDSVANGGSQLNDAQTFPAVASQRLAQAGCRNEILNASAGGWALFDEAAWLRQHGLSGARTLVWTINSLDLDQPPGTSAILDHNPSFPSHRPATALGEIVFRYALPRMGLGASTADNGSAMNQQFASDQFAAVETLVTAMKHEMDQRGVELIVLFHDTLTPLTDNRTQAKARFFDLLRTRGIPLMKTGLYEKPDAKTLYFDGIHPNATGDAMIGADLARTLRSRCPKS